MISFNILPGIRVKAPAITKAPKNRFNLNGIDISGVIFNAIEKKANSYYYDDIFSYSSALEGYYKAPTDSQFSK